MSTHNQFGYDNLPLKSILVLLAMFFVMTQFQQYEEKIDLPPKFESRATPIFTVILQPFICRDISLLCFYENPL